MGLPTMAPPPFHAEIQVRRQFLAEIIAAFWKISLRYPHFRIL
jgi:hypothetical protein